MWFDKFSKLPFPTSDLEVWRYSRIAELDLDKYPPAFTPSTSNAFVQAPLEQIEKLDTLGLVPSLGPLAGLVVSYNGYIVDTQIFPEGEGFDKRGLSIDSTPENHSHPDRPELGLSELDTDVFMELASSSLADTLFIRATSATDGIPARPVLIAHIIDSTNGASSCFPHSIIELEDGASLTVVEAFFSTGPLSHQPTGSPASGLVVPVAEMKVGDNANLTYLSLQDLAADMWGISYQISQVGGDANLLSFTGSFGGYYVRTMTVSTLLGPGGMSELLSVYFGSDSQMHDFRTFQYHVGAHTRSELLFKGAVKDTSHSVYSGLIKVQNGAVGTNAFQTNRNIVLSPGAKADSVPNLDINENDVSCSHASAVGPIDKDQLYYLESKGLSPKSAEKLIVAGFFNEIIDKKLLQPASGWLRKKIAEKL
ncbi:MAG: SufD family Fe-S cluster assembly protein [Actinobacteria bacterium]|nr:SufD family Fe-S cluster assembly protein [Actinomycetota bacterium]MCL6105447.1 SufD family Fe-S cluster assembly protein [Actinomycetota bacterium]